MSYASAEELDLYLAASGVVNDMEVEALLKRAEHDVDRAVGPRPVDPTTGLKFDPADLTDAQAGALSRATLAAAEFRIEVTERDLIGSEDYVPSELRIVREGGRVSPKMIEALEDSGLRN
jgi:hypothetical protein